MSSTIKDFWSKSDEMEKGLLILFFTMFTAVILAICALVAGAFSHAWRPLIG